MEYVTTYETAEYDNLLGGGDGVPVELVNVKLASGTEVKRGEILAADTPKGTFAAVSSTSDAEKFLVVAAENFIAASDSVVTSAYRSGKFNREKIILAEGLDANNFEKELRKQNIILTSVV